MMRIAVIGGGAAGFFAAVNCAETHPDCRVTIFERGRSVLEKVRISGGGRCNATHACFDARELVKYYPRGSRELLGPFTKFGPAETVEWFENHGVRLKTEADGRMFPVTDSSQTIIDCFLENARRCGVKVLTGTRVDSLVPQADGRWLVNGETFDKVLVATGSSASVWQTLEKLGHHIIPPVPSLFTFNTKDTRLRELAGVSAVNVELGISGLKITSSGPLLVTHWGLSGPAVLRLSAWAARELHGMDYRFTLTVHFVPGTDKEQLEEIKSANGKKVVAVNPCFGLPARLWQRLTEAAGIPEQRRWADLSKTDMQNLWEQLSAARFQVNGKSTFKEEFVTAGGVSLKEVNFNSFESKICPNLFLAGEVLDIDAVTGGFNFQAAWTGAWLAAQKMIG